MWLLPTLNRVDQLKKFLNSAIEAGTTTPGYIIVDDDDWLKNSEAYANMAMPSSWQFFKSPAVTMGDKCRAIWPELKGVKWVGILNDDHFIITKGWDRLMVNRLDGKNFCSANDRWMAPTKATTATVWSKGLLDALGWPIYPPGLQHLFIDDLWENLGRQTGCWRVCMNVVVEHHHALNGGMPKDTTFNAVYGENFPAQPSKMWDMDRAVFENIMKHDFMNAVVTIKKFQDKPAGQRFNPGYDKPGKGLLDEQTQSAAGGSPEIQL